MQTPQRGGRLKSWTVVRPFHKKKDDCPCRPFPFPFTYVEARTTTQMSGGRQTTPPSGRRRRHRPRLSVGSFRPAGTAHLPCVTGSSDASQLADRVFENPESDGIID